LHQKTDRLLLAFVLAAKRARYAGDFAKSHALANGHYFQSGYAGSGYEFESLNSVKAFDPGWIGTKIVGNEIHAALIHVTANLTKSALTEFRTGVLRSPPYNINVPTKSSRVSKLVEHFYICSLRQVPKSRIEVALPAFSFAPRLQEFFLSTKAKLPRLRLPPEIEAYAIDGWWPENEMRLFVRNPKEIRKSYLKLEQIEPPLSDDLGTAVLKVTDLRFVSRNIHVRIVGGVKSERDCQDSLSTVRHV